MTKAKQYPNVGVKLILKWHDGILMFKHEDGTFDFPGGTMEWGESIMETLRRELKEELDYDLRKEPELFSVYNHISLDKKQHKVLIQYILELSRDPKFVSLEKVDFFWLSKKEARPIFGDEKMLDKIFRD